MSRALSYSSQKSDFIPYCSSHYTSDFCKDKAKELRQSGNYIKVKLGSYFKENGKKYCKIYVIPKSSNIESCEK